MCNLWKQGCFSRYFYVTALLTQLMWTFSLKYKFHHLGKKNHGYDAEWKERIGLHKIFIQMSSQRILQLLENPQKRTLSYYMEGQKFWFMHDSVSNNICDLCLLSKAFVFFTRKLSKYKSISSGRCFKFSVIAAQTISPLSEEMGTCCVLACAINLCFHTAVLFISGVPMVTKFM